jgi:hypothetical protein
VQLLLSNMRWQPTQAVVASRANERNLPSHRSHRAGARRHCWGWVLRWDMPSLEQSVRDQFAKVFSTSDWQLFKQMAEIYLSEAAFLKKSSFEVPENRKLLVRNSRKRLLIGIGAELLLKAVYLRKGYCINKPQDAKSPLRLPFTPAEVADVPLNASDTYTLDQLIGQLKKIIKVQNLTLVLNGLRIAKVFRNKEGHVVTYAHRFDPSSFRTIEGALVDLYRSAFHEELTVRFSFTPREKGAWYVAP